MTRPGTRDAGTEPKATGFRLPDRDDEIVDASASAWRGELQIQDHRACRKGDLEGGRAYRRAQAPRSRVREQR